MRGWVLRGCVTYLSYAGWPEIHLSGVCCKRATKGVCHPSHTRRAFCLSKDWLLSALACSAREGGSGGREGGRRGGRGGGSGQAIIDSTHYGSVVYQRVCKRVVEG